MKNFKKYLRELSIVVVGIGITFIVSNQISEFNERRMVKRHLNAIKAELEHNIELINERYIFYKQTRLLSDYLRQDKPINLNSDSIYHISLFQGNNSVIDNVFILAFETTALETLKASGMMALIKNEVSSDILKAYKRLDAMALTSNDYMENKKEVIIKSMLDHGFNMANEYETFDLRDPKMEKLYNFLCIPNNYHDQLKGDCMYYINKALSQL